MQLFYSDASPYARKVRVVLHEIARADSVRLVRTNPLDDPDELLAANPLAKVPALIAADGNAIVDSLAIVFYLQTHFAVRGDLAHAGQDVGQLQRHAIANGVIDAALGLVLEGRRDSGERSALWSGRWQRAITRGLGVVAATELPLDRFDLGDVTLAVALEYLDFRLPHIDWRTTTPELADWLAETGRRPSMLTTRPA